MSWLHIHKMLGFVLFSLYCRLLEAYYYLIFFLIGSWTRCINKLGLLLIWYSACLTFWKRRDKPDLTVEACNSRTWEVGQKDPKFKAILVSWTNLRSAWANWMGSYLKKIVSARVRISSQLLLLWRLTPFSYPVDCWYPELKPSVLAGTRLALCKATTSYTFLHFCWSEGLESYFLENTFRIPTCEKRSHFNCYGNVRSSWSFRWLCGPFEKEK